MNIAKIINLSEGKTIEFKRDASSLKPILKTVIAFANTAGGLLILGMTDDNKIIGVSDPLKLQDQLANSIADNIVPLILPEFEIVTYKNKTLLILQVHRGISPYYLKQEGEPEGIYVRLGATTRRASPELIKEIEQQRSSVSFDTLPCSGCNITSLDQNLINKLFAKRNHKLTQAKLLTLKIITKDSGRTFATNGGIILFGKKEEREDHFPNIRVSCARFAGTTKAEFIDRLEIEDGIFQALEEVPKFIRRNTMMAAEFDGSMQRKDIAQYPVLAIRETLINAFAHANYEIKGSHFYIAIYDDRLEIQSPGLLPLGMTLEYFKAGVSRIRNKMIVRIFRELKLIEEWGSGYKRIIDECQAKNYPEPHWEELGSVFRVTFYPHKEIKKIAKEATKKRPRSDQEATKKSRALKEYNSEQIAILGYCTKARIFTDIMEKCKKKHRATFRKNYLLPLLIAGLLEMTEPESRRSKKQKYVTTKKGKELLQSKKK